MKYNKVEGFCYDGKNNLNYIAKNYKNISNVLSQTFQKDLLA